MLVNYVLDINKKMNDAILDFISTQLDKEISKDVTDLLGEIVNVIANHKESAYSLFGNYNANELIEARCIDETMKNLVNMDYDDSDDEFDMHELKCDACESRASLFWRRVTRTKIVCNVCFFSKIYLIAFDDAHLNAKKGSSNIHDLMEILGDELGLNENSHKKSRTKNAKSKKQAQNGASRLKQKFLALAGDQAMSTRPLTRTSAKASYLTQVSTSSAATSAENQNGEDESCASSSASDNTEQKQAWVINSIF